jgi:dihydroorotase
LYAKALIETGLCDWPALIERMTAGPARAIGRPLGTLAEGALADVTIIDPNASWTVNTEKFRSRSRNCPYHGWKLTGRAVATLVAGEIKFTL